ncbi:hypothetical protein PGT21_006527 [Puccinia graminis f. sp. tritici]|uniref:Uncharacterized protein n=1 Tax=Puccinia graminis f. sp. tritici TaxID=56615 RepID=A0A5B0M6G8_PUCGR|nr:hypothetical protein PGT21_006527 [Puccinia graminis f. sp. tritici]KAA1123120.1 hypothetical protein PGTUg99_010830 [Puccinia graminis f. sp. tritici]
MTENDELSRLNNALSVQVGKGAFAAQSRCGSPHESFDPSTMHSVPLSLKNCSLVDASGKRHHARTCLSSRYVLPPLRLMAGIGGTPCGTTCLQKRHVIVTLTVTSKKYLILVDSYKAQQLLRFYKAQQLFKNPGKVKMLCTVAQHIPLEVLQNP